jgi:hypothetical protein
MTAKRANWTWGIARSHEELAEADVAFWARATPEERLRHVERSTTRPPFRVQ